MTQPIRTDLTRREALQLLLASSAATGLIALTHGRHAMADPTVSSGPAPAYLVYSNNLMALSRWALC